MKKYINIPIFVTFAIVIISIPSIVTAQVPQTLSYQGVITTDSGQPADDGDYTIHFRLYAGPESGEPLWSETQTVDVTNGLFSVLLGSAAPLDLPFDLPYYLGVTIGEASELTPRTALVSSAYSLRARTIDDGQAVKSINEMTDSVTIEAGSNVSITTADNRIIISAVSDSSAGDQLWQRNGENIFNVNSGRVGIGTQQTYNARVAIANSDENYLYGLIVHQTGSGTEAAINALGGYTGVYGEGHRGGGITTGVTGRTYTESGYGVYGIAGHATGNTYGIYGLTSSVNGNGVFGEAAASTGLTYGVRGLSKSTTGRGVSGMASAASGINYGVWGVSQSTEGRGVFGEASASSGTTYGVFGQSSSTSGHGVFGLVDATSGINSGVYGQSSSTSGHGVFGLVDAGSGTTFGVYGESQSTAGQGVYGLASATSGINNGVIGRSQSTSGRGVLGWATAASGTNYGVYGRTESPGGYAAYFAGAVGSRNYFQRSVGIGTESPQAMLHLVDASSEISIMLKAGNSWTAQIQQTNSSNFNFYNGGNVRMTIRAGGQVGIGTEEPGSFRLAVNGDAAKPGGGSWSVFSDKRLKNDIRPLDNGSLDRLLQLQGYTFEYLDEAIENRLALPGRQTGLIAQEVLEVFPDWVDTDDEGYLYVTERGLTALLIEALRELKSEKDNEISALHQRIQHLELYLLQITSAE